MKTVAAIWLGRGLKSSSEGKRGTLNRKKDLGQGLERTYRKDTEREQKEQSMSTGEEGVHRLFGEWGAREWGWCLMSKGVKTCW